MNVDMFLSGILILCVVLAVALAVLAPIVALAGYRSLRRRGWYPRWLWGLFVLGGEALCIGGMAVISTIIANSSRGIKQFGLAEILSSPNFLFGSVGILVVGAVLLTFVAFRIIAKWDVQPRP